jgi:hypothetical protein
MSGFNAFVCDVYYDAWATAEVEAGRQPTQLRFLQEFGTPYLHYSQGHKYTQPKYIIIPPGTGVRINFNYFSEMKLRFPNINYKDPNINYIEDAMTPVTKRIYKWILGFFSKRSTVTPVST